MNISLFTALFIFVATFLAFFSAASQAQQTTFAPGKETTYPPGQVTTDAPAPQTTSAGTTTNVNPGCAPFMVGNRLVNPATWNVVNNYFNLTESASGIVTPYFAGISLCQTIPYYTTQGGSGNPSYVILQNMTANPAGFFPNYGFDGYFGGEHFNNVLVMTFSASDDANILFKVVTVCNPNVTVLQLKNHVMTSHVDPQGRNILTVTLETSDMCATTEAPQTTSAPMTSTTVANTGCAPFVIDNRIVYPQSWGVVHESTHLFRYVNLTSHAEFTIGMSISPCEKMPAWTVAGSAAPEPSYAYMINRSSTNTGFHPFVTFDTFWQSRVNEFGLIQEYTSSNNPSYALRLRTHCNASARHLTPASDFVESMQVDNITMFFVSLYIDQMCNSSETTVAPLSTTQAPAPQTTLPPATGVPCAPIILDGKVVDPNIVWSAWVGDYVSFPQLPGTSVYLAGSMCTIPSGYTLAPGTPNAQIPGYWVIGPYDHQFYSTTYDLRELQEVNDVGQFVKYKYSSTATQNELFVYIHCRQTASTGLTFQTNEMTFWNNTRGGTVFTVHFVSSAVCPAPTTAAPEQCKSFIDNNGVTHNPLAFPPTQGVLKNLMSGEAATVLVDVCKMHHFTSSPSMSFAPGYIILLPFGGDNWPQTSFDIISSARYLPGWMNEYQVTYRSSQPNRTEDRATVRIQCGTSNGLSFADRFILPERNPQGGTSYQISLATKLMCADQTTTFPPPPMTTAAPLILPTKTRTMDEPPLPPPQTTAALLRRQRKN